MTVPDDRPSLAEDIAALDRIIERLRLFDQGFGEDVLLRVLSILQQHERVTAELDAARAALRECVLQIEYLHDKFAATGTGEAVWERAVLYRVTEYLAKTGDWAEEDIAALRGALATLDGLTADLAPANERIRQLDAENQGFMREVALLNERIARLEGAMQPMIEALEFYADPETYFGLAVIADPPCGGFAEDFSDDHGHPSLDGNRYGKTARKAFELADAALSPVET
jgi:cell division protein FtsB